MTKLGLNLTLSKEKEKACRKYPRSNGSASSTSRRVQSGRGFRTSSGETQSDHKFNDISGFVGFILTVLLYVVYLIWAFVPDSYLHRIGVTWLPSKFWTLAIPTWMYISYIFFMLFPTVVCWTPRRRSDAIATQPLPHIATSAEPLYSMIYKEFKK